MSGIHLQGPEEGGRPSAAPETVRTTAMGRTWTTFFTGALASLVTTIGSLFSRRPSPVPADITSAERFNDVKARLGINIAKVLGSLREGSHEKIQISSLLRAVDNSTSTAEQIKGLWRAGIQALRYKLDSRNILIEGYQAFAKEDPKRALAESFLEQAAFLMGSCAEFETRDRASGIVDLLKNSNMSNDAIKKMVTALKPGMPNSVLPSLTKAEDLLSGS